MTVVCVSIVSGKIIFASIKQGTREREHAISRASAPMFAVSSFPKLQVEHLELQGARDANSLKCRFGESRFATMLSRSKFGPGYLKIEKENTMTDFEWSRPGMALRSGAELQAARKAAAERFQAIAAKYVPEGYTVEYRKSLSGRHYGQRKLIQAPRPVTRKSLYIFLHECAHAHLHVTRRPPAHVREMEAEKWAHDKMRENGVAVPRSMTVRAKEYVARKIRQARRSGAKSINAEAARYAS